MLIAKVREVQVPLDVKKAELRKLLIGGERGLLVDQAMAEGVGKADM